MVGLTISMYFQQFENLKFLFLSGGACHRPPKNPLQSVQPSRIWRIVLILHKVTVQFQRCFRLMEHISVISRRNPINLYITEKLIKFSKSLSHFYLVISNN